MQAKEVDVVVIGMGPGGEYVAGTLASNGLTVVGIEANLVGGECPYWGCIPSKMMIRASDALAEGNRINELAGTSVVSSDWGKVAQRVREVATDNWNDRVAAERFESKGGQLVRGFATLLSNNEVQVGELRFRTRRGIVLATGSQPLVPNIAGLAGTPYWTNHEALETRSLPRSITILGGGAIGVELAQVFARFGTVTHVVDGGPHLLAREEPESGALLAKVFEREGIQVSTGARAESVSHDDDGFTVSLSAGKSLKSEGLLVAVGRSVDLHSLGVDAIGQNPDARSIEVDANMRVAPNVWAVGDITGKGAFTHVSMYQASIAISDILGKPHAPADYKALPRVTFTDPEIGAVGLTEAAARETYERIQTGFVELSASSRGFTHGPGNDGFIKLVVDTDRNVLLGATSAGPSGGEVLGLLALAVHESTPVQRLREMIYAYPTFHRAIESALADL